MIRLISVCGMLGLGLACGPSEPKMSEPTAPAERAYADNGVFVRKTQSGHYNVELRFDPGVPPMGELFRVVTTLRDRDGVPIEAAKVSVDAGMPQHNHGMMTDPVDDPGECDEAGVCTHPGGRFVTTGFKFHMAGEWTVTVEVEGPRGRDTTSFVYEMR